MLMSFIVSSDDSHCKIFEGLFCKAATLFFLQNPMQNKSIFQALSQTSGIYVFILWSFIAIIVNLAIYLKKFFDKFTLWKLVPNGPTLPNGPLIVPNGSSIGIERIELVPQS